MAKKKAAKKKTAKKKVTKKNALIKTGTTNEDVGSALKRYYTSPMEDTS